MRSTSMRALSLAVLSSLLLAPAMGEDARKNRKAEKKRAAVVEETLQRMFEESAGHADG